MKITKTYLALLSGIFLEYFDYTLYGFSAPYIEHVFFPTEKPEIATLMIWGLFAASFIVRPFGALLFGHLADCFGRRKVLTTTLIMMSISTLLIGLLPSYQQLGAFSPFLLLLCRIAQGLSVSTEYSGCSTYLFETFETRRGLVSGLTTSASGFGIFAASTLVLGTNSVLSSHALGLAAWRWPFILAGLIIGLLGSYLRLSLVESPAFLAIQQAQTISKLPLQALIREKGISLLTTIAICACTGVGIVMIEVYLPTHLQDQWHINKTKALCLASALAFTEACFAIAWGAASDYLGRKNTLSLGALLLLLGLYPVLQLFSTTNPILWLTAVIILACMLSACDGPMAAFLSEQFPTRYRYSGVSLAYSLGAALLGGLSPSLFLLIQAQWQNNFLYCLYIMSAALLMLLAISFSRLQLGKQRL
ncbi:MAG: hypothetical protein COV52_02125 [Gammaproteobacteria bacterium CG11_big_fil_rev_8_21_14_0_20_46_22]|nr:MAG: hypothetical protein COW05_04985 [Gammaproteobacteria bacterium CG12_big_fil_rev_8_21_14_0_65_46_12]PIR11787.1 MAG: hypothetical protein COV52_02125 [Gammaproteobacteria bacterium CG11_big_fil_rev_8_21_14_0_20_46_22]